MGSRRRSAHRPARSFLKVTEAESTADVQALAHRIRRAIHEAEVLGLADVRSALGDVLQAVLLHATRDRSIAGESSGSRSIGEPEVAASP